MAGRVEVYTRVVAGGVEDAVELEGARVLLELDLVPLYVYT